LALQFRRIQATVSRFGHVVTRDIETLTGMDITSAKQWQSLQRRRKPPRTPNRGPTGRNGPIW